MPGKVAIADTDRITAEPGSGRNEPNPPSGNVAASNGMKDRREYPGPNVNLA